jgi:hypothetical protein
MRIKGGTQVKDVDDSLFATAAPDDDDDDDDDGLGG